MIARLTRSLAVRAALTLGVVAILLGNIDFFATMASLARLRLTAALATLALVAIDRGVMILRWVVLLRAAGAAISAKAAVWIHLVSSFVGGFLPAGVGADAVRAFSLSRRTANSSEAVASVAVDRALGLLSMIIVGLAGVLVWARRVDPNIRHLLTIATALSVAACIGFLWADRAIRTALPARWHRTGMGTRVMRLADALARYRGHRGALAAVLLLSIAVQLLRITQAYLLGRGIGIDVPFAYYLVFMPIGLIALLLPVSISGFGFPQGVIVWLLQPVGVADYDSLALSTLIVFTGIVANLPGAVLYLRGRRTPEASVS